MSCPAVDVDVDDNNAVAGFFLLAVVLDFCIGVKKWLFNLYHELCDTF